MSEVSRFVVVSGVPGSGKTTLARQLAPLLGLPLIDKDDILERLFDSNGLGDAAWRRTLSREADRELQAEATASAGAILVSFWHRPGMAADSGTPTAWLSGLTEPKMNVHCVCPPDLAAERFFRRTRHPGHLDIQRSYEDILRTIRDNDALAPIQFGTRIEIDTSGEVDVNAICAAIESLLGRRSSA